MLRGAGCYRQNRRAVAPFPPPRQRKEAVKYLACSSILCSTPSTTITALERACPFAVSCRTSSPSGSAAVGREWGRLLPPGEAGTDGDDVLLVLLPVRLLPLFRAIEQPSSLIVPATIDEVSSELPPQEIPASAVVASVPRSPTARFAMRRCSTCFLCHCKCISVV